MTVSVRQKTDVYIHKYIVMPNKFSTAHGVRSMDRLLKPNISKDQQPHLQPALIDGDPLLRHIRHEMSTHKTKQHNNDDNDKTTMKYASMYIAVSSMQLMIWEVCFIPTTLNEIFTI